MICKDGALTGKVALFKANEIDYPQNSINEHVFLLRTNTKILQKYLFNILYLISGQALLKSNITGQAQGGLNRANLLSIKIPIPPKEIQQKIIDEIEVLEKQEDKATTNIINLQNNINNIVHSLESYEFIKIHSTDIQIIDGDRGKNYPSKKEFTNKGYCVFLNAKNFVNNKFCFSDINFISKEQDELLNNGKLQKGDVVLTTRGTIGKVAYYDKKIELEHIRINSGMLIFRSNKNILNKFLLYLFSSNLIQKQFVDLTSGSAVPQLPIKDLQNIKMPIPKIEEQQKIVKQIEKIETKINQLEIEISAIPKQKEQILRQYL